MFLLLLLAFVFVDGNVRDGWGLIKREKIKGNIRHACVINWSG